MITDSQWRLGFGFLVATVAVGYQAAARLGAGDPAAAETAGRRAVVPAAPLPPAEVLEALEEGRFEQAAQALARQGAVEKDAEARGYFALLEAKALRLAEKRDQAQLVLKRALEQNPGGRFHRKLAGELADLDQKGGDQPTALALLQEITRELLSGPRKDALAKVYHDFAQKLLEPGDPLQKPDPESAHALLEQAHELAASPAERARLLFQTAMASQTAGNDPRAVVELRRYLADHPREHGRFAARLALGESLRRSGQAIPARATLSDLARDLEIHKDLPKQDADSIRARALYEIALTHGIPKPPNRSDLSRGVRALQQFLSAYPRDPKAVTAAYQIALSYEDFLENENPAAIAALRRFLEQRDFKLETDAARREFAELAMSATFAIGRILDGAEWHDEAIAAWKSYLARFPNGPQGTEAQRSILTTRLKMAEALEAAEKHAEARAAWRRFITENPLHDQVPKLLLLIGESHREEKQFDQAIAVWDELAQRFPKTEPAGQGEYEAALLVETVKGDPAAAIDRLRKIVVEAWRPSALNRIREMEAKHLAVVTPRVFRTGEIPRLKVATRNLESLTFSSYKLDAEAYYRKKATIAGVEQLDIGLVAPDVTWTVPVPGQARYKPVETEYELKALASPGVHVVRVSDEKTLQATTLVIASDLDAVVKASSSQVLVFAQDMKTGRGRAGAKVLVSENGQVILEGAVGADGVLIKDWASLKGPSAQLSYLVLDGGHVAGTSLATPGAVARGLSPRASLDTDRPVYRPGQTVQIRGVVREVGNGQYVVHPGAGYQFEVADSQGRMIASRNVALSAFGTFHETVGLDPGAPLGDYQVHVFQPRGSSFTGKFVVQSYELRPFDLEFKLDRAVYYRGETIKGAVVAHYPHGAPASRPVVIMLPDGGVLRGSTDQAGQFAFELQTTEFLEDQDLALKAALPEDGVDAQARIRIASLGFKIKISLLRHVYASGETVPVTIETTDALGAPIGVDLELVLSNRFEADREIKRLRIKTDPTNGTTKASFRLDDADGGERILSAGGIDRFGNRITEQEQFAISGSKHGRDLLILSDRQTWKVGERAKVNLNSRTRTGTALVTWDADRILAYKLVELHAGDNPLEWEVAPDQAPNMSLTATRMWRDELDQASLDLIVERDLKVTVMPARSEVGPGDGIELAVSTTDQIGRPVSAELAVSMIDAALLRLGVEPAPAIDAFFYDQTRLGAFALEATNGFRYEPPTTPVARAVVEAEEQAAGEKADLAERRQVAGQLGAISLGKRVVMAPSAMGRRGAAGLGFGGMGGGIVVDPFQEQPHDARAATAPPGGALAGAPGSEAPPRARRTETAYWNPHVVTGKDGKAKVVLKAPSSMATYRVLARGATGSDTLVGQHETSIAVAKRFFVELQAPLAVNEGDRPRFLARLHHGDTRGQAELKLVVRAGGRESVYPRTVELGASGLVEIVFDPYEVPGNGPLALSLSATAKDARDSVAAECQVRPWGVRAVASAAGSSQGDETLLLELPPGREYSQPEMRIVISPARSGLIADLALGSGWMGREPMGVRSIPIPVNLGRASDLLAAAQAIDYLRKIKAGLEPESRRLVEQARALASGLVAAQNNDGGWPWAIHSPSPYHLEKDNATPASERRTSALVVWALAATESLGLLPDRRALERGLAYLKQDYGRIAAGDHESRALVLHALSTQHAAGFEEANSVNRARAGLSSASLARLVLIFASLDRPTMAGEALALLISRAKRETVAPGHPERVYWDDAGVPGGGSALETTALVALAFASARPTAHELPAAITWLESRRQGLGFRPRPATGAIVAALAAFHGKAQEAAARYRLTVTVNDVKIAAIDVAGPGSSLEFAPPATALRLDRPNRVGLVMEGRGHYAYAATLSGFTRTLKPDQERAGQAVVVEKRVYSPAAPELDGRRLATGFTTVLDPKPFENIATQAGLGESVRVTLHAARVNPANRPMGERDGVIVQDFLPAGSALVEGSITSSADSVSLDDGVLTFAFGPGRDPGVIQYELASVVPGAYRLPPARARLADVPGTGHLGEPSALLIRARGEPGGDPYQPTPDELLARGRAQFQAGRFALAAAALEPFALRYTPRDEFLSEAAKMLLIANLELKKPREIVRYFELVKEKAPELVLGYDQLFAIAAAYQDINEYERAIIVWRGLIEASFLEDARVGELLRQRGRPLEAIAYLIDLWRAYPDSPALESDFFGLSQVVIETAGRAATDLALRRQLTAAGVTRPALLLQGARMLRLFLAQSPTNPLADDASLALLGVVSDEGNDEAVLALAERFARIRPKSKYVDGFGYARALAAFKLGRYDQAITSALAISRAVYKSPAGDLPSPNKWQAVYILGQIHDARREPAKALEYYRQVADRYRDAASAVAALSRKELQTPEITLASRAPAGAAGGLRAVDPAPGGIAIDYRNLAQVELKVYPVDLMRLYLTRRDLSAIASIDLAGIKPLVHKEIPLGAPSPEKRSRTIDLPLDRDGAYLVMLRGENVYGSGVVLVSPLELEVLEEPASGGVRVTVRDARTHALEPKVQVKISGNMNGGFISGETDLRGVFLAEGLQGWATVVARKGTAQYALYRGRTVLGPSIGLRSPPDRSRSSKAEIDQSLEGNLPSLNQMNNAIQIQRLQDRFKQLPADKVKGAAAGSLR